MEIVLAYGPLVPFLVSLFFWGKGLWRRTGSDLVAGGVILALSVPFHFWAMRFSSLSALPWVFLLLFGIAAAAAGALRRDDARAMRREIVSGAACVVLAGALFLCERAWLAPSNSILVIAPYRYAGTWVFDDPRVGLTAEPFVAKVPELIDKLVEDVPRAEKGFRLLFSAAPFPGHSTKLVWRRSDGAGNWYYSEEYDIEGWLCPALFKYFRRAPEEIYVKAEPIPEGPDG